MVPNKLPEVKKLTEFAKLYQQSYRMGTLRFGACNHPPELVKDGVCCQCGEKVVS